MTALLGILLGAGFGGGLVLLVAAFRGWTPQTSTRSTAMVSAETRRRILFAIAAGLVVAVVTRWPVAVGAVVALVVLWPKMVGAAAITQSELDRIEALTTWTESLRDTVAGAMGLEQAIPATVTAAPQAIRAPLDRLVGSIQSRIPLTAGLARFADEFADPAADLVVAALILNAQLRGPGLTATLSALATTAREELEMRRRVAEGRRALRRSVITIVVVVLAFAGGLVLFSRNYVAPYGSLAGQLVLVLVLVLFAGAFMRMRQLATTPPAERFLAAPDQLAAAVTAGASGGGGGRS